MAERRVNFNIDTQAQDITRREIINDLRVIKPFSQNGDKINFVAHVFVKEEQIRLFRNIFCNFYSQFAPLFSHLLNLNHGKNYNPKR